MKTKVKALILPLLTNPLSWSQCSSRARSAKKAQKADQKAQQTAAEQAEKAKKAAKGEARDLTIAMLDHAGRYKPPDAQKVYFSSLGFGDQAA